MKWSCEWENIQNYTPVKRKKLMLKMQMNGKWRSSNIEKDFESFFFSLAAFAQLASLRSWNVNVSISISSSLNVNFKIAIAQHAEIKSSSLQSENDTWAATERMWNCKKKVQTTALSCKQIWKHKSFMFSGANDNSKNARVQLKLTKVDFLQFTIAVGSFRDLATGADCILKKKIFDSGNYFITKIVNPDPVILIYCCLQTSSRCRWVAMSQQGCGAENLTTTDHVNNLRNIRPQNRLESHFDGVESK